MKNRQIISIAVGLPRTYMSGGKEYTSAIGKQRVSNMYITKQGIIGDGVAHTDIHGGPDRALCLYPIEHYGKWENEFGKKIDVPALGENITASGMTEKEVCIGDIYKIGDAVVQATQGRIPCSSISKYNSLDPLLKRVYETCLSGCFFRVLEEGEIRQDSSIQLLEKGRNEISIFDVSKIVLHKNATLEEIQNILQLEDLAMEWRRILEKIALKFKSENPV